VTTGDGTERPTERTCKTPGCGKTFKIDLRRLVQERYYCGRDCAERYARARRYEREARAAVPLPPRPCASCAVDFVPTNSRDTTCSRECRSAYRDAYQRANRGGARARLTAAKTVTLPPAPTVCADCGQPARRDTSSRGLVYCSDRCGWSVLLTARERDARADTPDPTPDDDQETEMSEEERAIDAEEEEGLSGAEAAPGSVPAARAPTAWPRQAATAASRKEALNAVTRGISSPIKIIRASGKGRTAVFRALEALREQGAVVRVGVANATRYYLPGKVPVDAPAPAPPKRKAVPDGSRARARAANELAVIAAIGAGHACAEAIVKTVGKHPSSVYLAINRLVEEGRVIKGGVGNSRVYTLAEQTEARVSTGQAAPPTCPPAPVAPASLRSQIAALPPAELLALLDALAPVAAHARALAAALAALQVQP